MRRLFLVLDLSLLRQPGEDQRQAVLQQLTTAIGRLWAAYQHSNAGNGGAATQRISWGYALYDSACPDLLLKPQLRRTAQNLRLPAAFQDNVQTDCRGAELTHLLALLAAATRPSEGAGNSRGARDGNGEPPAAALARVLQSALGSSYLLKLKELADNDSGSGSSAEGLLAVFSLGLSTTAQLQRFLGPSFVAPGSAARPAGAPAQQLLAAAMPAALWQRCAGGSLRVCWVAAGGEQQEEQLAVLPALNSLMRQRCSKASAAPLAELAGPCSRQQFAARLALPRAEEQQEQPQRQQVKGPEVEGDFWPAAASPQEDALENLKLLLGNLEGDKEREAEAAKRLVRAQHRQLARQRTGVPPAARRGAAPVANKGAALLENARRIQADKNRRGTASQPTSGHGTPTGGAGTSDDQAHVLKAAAGASGEEGEEASSSRALAPDRAVADLKGRLAELAGSVAAAEEAPEPLALLDQIRRLVDPCFSAMLAYSTRRSRQQPAAGTPAAAADGEATSAPVAAAAAAGGGRPPLPPQQDLLTLDCMRSLLLQQVPAAVADLRRQHVEAAEPQQRRQLARRLLLELYLRLSICAYGSPAGGELPAGQFHEIEVVIQMLAAVLLPFPQAGHDLFLQAVKKPFGPRFPADMRRLQQEMWDDGLSLDFDSIMGEQRDKGVELEVSGETPNCSSGPAGSGATHPHRQRQSSSALTAVRSGAVGAGGAGPSNLGRSAAAQRDSPAREGTASGRPSAGTARASGSVMSGEHSGIQGGGSRATTGAATARSGAAAARTATSQGALVNLTHIRQRYNNTNQLKLQVRSKVPAGLMQKSKLKHTVATSRPTSAAAGGTSRAAGPAGTAAGKGRGAAGGLQQHQQLPPRAARRQVPATPDSRGKALRELDQATAATAGAVVTAALQLHQHQHQHQQHSLLSGGVVVSPDDAHLALVLPSGAAAPPAAGSGSLEAIPDTEARPRLPGVPAELGAAVEQLMRGPGTRLEFGAPAAAPGAILPSQRRPGGEEGGSATTSPAGAAEGPTWLVAATRAVRGRGGAPGVASLGVLAAGSQQQLPEPAAEAAPPSAADGAEQQEQEAADGMDVDGAAGTPASPAHDPLAPAAPAGEAEEAAAPPADAASPMEAEGPTPAPPAEPPAAAGEAAKAAAVPSTSRRTRSAAAAAATEGAAVRRRSRGRAVGAAAAAPAGVEAEPASTVRRGRSRSKGAVDAATPADPQQYPGGQAVAAVSAPSTRRTTRSTPAAAVAGEQAQQQEEPAMADSAPSTRRGTRRTPAAAAAGEEQQAQQEEEEAAAPVAVADFAPSTRRGTRRTPAAAAAGEEPAMAVRVTDSAPSTRRGKRRSAAAADEEHHEEAAPEVVAPADEPAAAAAGMVAEPETVAAEEQGDASQAQPRPVRARRHSSRFAAEEEQEPAAEQEEQLAAAAPQPRRRSAVAAEAEDAAGLGKEEQRLVQMQARRGTRSAAAASPAAAPAAAAPKPAARSSRGKKRRASGPAEAPPAEPQAEELAPAAAPESATAGVQQEDEEQPTPSASQLAAIVCLFGCRSCRQSKSGCFKCRPKVAAALQAAHLDECLVGVGNCGKGSCALNRRGCATCWAAVQQQLCSLGASTKPAAAAEGEVAAAAGAEEGAAAPLVVAAAPAPEPEQAMEVETATETAAVPPPAAKERAGTAQKRRKARHSAAQETAAVPQPAAAAAAVVEEPLQEEEAEGMEAAGEAVVAAQATDEGGRQSGRRSRPTAVQRMAFGLSTDAAQQAVEEVQQEEQPQGEPAAEAAATAGPPPTAARRLCSAARSEQQAEEAEAAAAALSTARRRGRSAGPVEPQAEEAAKAPPSATRRAGRKAGPPEQQAEAAPPAAKVPGTGLRRGRSAGELEPDAAAEAPAAATTTVATGKRRSLIKSMREAAEEAADAAEAAAAAVLAAAPVEGAEAAAAAGRHGAMVASPELLATAWPAAAVAMEVEGAAAVQPPPAALPQAAGASADPVAAAMAAAGALSEQLGEGEVDMGFEQVMAAELLTPADMAVALPAAAALAAAAAAPAAAAGPEGTQAEEQEGAPASARRRQSGGSGGSAFKHGKGRLSIMKGAASSKAKKRSAAGEATSGGSKRRSAGAGAASVRSPLAPLLQQAAATSGGGPQPSSPYDGAYGFPEDGRKAAARAAAAAAAAAKAAAEVVADSGAPHAAPVAAVAAAAAPVGVPDAGSPTGATPGAPAAADGLPEAATAAATAGEAGTAAAGGSAERVPASEGEQQQSPPQRQLPQPSWRVQQSPVLSAAARGPTSSFDARTLAAAAAMQQEVSSQVTALTQRRQQQQQQQQPDGSPDSCPESAVPDSQLQQLSPGVAGPVRGAAHPQQPAPTPQSRQRRLSPRGPAAGKQRPQLPRGLPVPMPVAGDKLSFIQSASADGSAEAGHEPRLFLMKLQVAAVEQQEASADGPCLLARAKRLDFQGEPAMSVSLRAASWVPPGQPLTQAGQWQQLFEGPGSGSSARPSGATLRPAGPPAETVRHNTAARMQQRRNSTDSLVLPQSVAQRQSLQAALLPQVQQQQQAGGALFSPTSTAPRQLFGAASPAHGTPAAAGHGSALRSSGRPPLPSAPATAAAPGGPAYTPHRLPLIAAYKPQQLAQASPARTSPRLQLQQQGRQQAAASTAAAVDAPLADSSQAQGGDAAAAAAPGGLGSEGQLAAAEARLRALLPDQHDRAFRFAQPRASAEGLAGPGDVLLYCSKRDRKLSLPVLELALVLSVEEVGGSSSPRQKFSHVAETLVLARGINDAQLEPPSQATFGTAELGKAGCKQQQKGVREMRHWCYRGTLSGSQFNPLKQAADNLRGLRQQRSQQQQQAA